MTRRLFNLPYSDAPGYKFVLDMRRWKWRAGKLRRRQRIRLTFWPYRAGANYKTLPWAFRGPWKDQ